jgi:hypothetical protein
MTKEEIKTNIIAYVGMLEIDTIRKMSYDSIKALIVSDAEMMEEEQKHFTLEHIDDILSEIEREAEQ